MLIILSLYTCGTIGYGLTLGILYMFCFSEAEMARLASYERYMASYLLGEILILLFLFIYNLNSNHSHNSCHKQCNYYYNYIHNYFDNNYNILISPDYP